MRVRLLSADPIRTYAVVFDKGDDLVAGLGCFARDEGVNGAALTGVGACSRSTLGYFDRSITRYLEIPVHEQAELLSMVGDIATGADGPAVHAHAVLGLPDGTTRGGHLLAAEVWPTAEIIVTETPGHLRKRHDPETGLALIDLNVSEGPDRA